MHTADLCPFLRPQESNGRQNGELGLCAMLPPDTALCCALRSPTAGERRAMRFSRCLSSSWSWRFRCSQSLNYLSGAHAYAVSQFVYRT